MRNILTITVLLFAFSLHAQKEVTTFLGIPVDGTKSEMINKLKEKGFTYKLYADCLTGKFNNKDVIVYVVTQNDKVWRIFILEDCNYDRHNVILRYNELLSQFEKDINYTKATGSEILSFPDSEYTFPDDINDEYALFIQENKTKVIDQIKPLLLQKYSEAQLANPDIGITLGIQIEIIEYACTKAQKLFGFNIVETDGMYHITLYYDNLHNHQKSNNSGL